MKTRIIVMIVLSVTLCSVLPALAQTMGYGSSLQLPMAAYDNHTITFEGNPGDVVDIYVAGSCNNGENLNPNFSVFTPDSDFIQHDEDSGGGCANVDAAMSITLTQSGVHTIRLYNRQAGGVASVSINCPTLNCFAPTPAPLTPPVNPNNNGNISVVTLPDPVFNPHDDRINRHFKDQGAPVAIYCHDWGIQIRSINPLTGRGADPADIDISNEALAALPTALEENRLIAEAGTVQLWRLSSGEFQVNALEWDGKPYVFVWDQCDPTESYHIQTDMPFTLDYVSLRNSE